MTGKLILLMNHEVSIRLILQVCLSRIEGWQVTSQGLTHETLERLGTEPPDVILLNTPVLNEKFLTQIQTLKKHPVSQVIPILLFTADARWLSSRQFAELGVVGAITPPFDPLDLPDRIVQLLHWD